MKIIKWIFKRGINKALLNPDFIKYVEDSKQGQDHKTGKIPYREYTPPPVNLSYLTGKKIFSHLRATALPSSFDLRKEGRVISVKNEGPAGAAWAFAEDWKLSFNHAVCLVGWDDNYDRRKFKNLPPGPGVFIAKNCWGTKWGDKGYFYISYYDQMVGKDNALFSKVMNPNIYNVIYQYDPLGWCDSAGASSTTAWFANMFTSTSAQELRAVSWYVASPDSSYNLYIYTNPTNSDPRSGKLVKSLNGKVLEPSYYQKTFSTPVKLTNGQKFSVVVEATTPGWDWPVPLQMPIEGYSSKARSEPGQGFLSMDGESWLDVTEVFENASVCLKAFASTSDRSKRGTV